MTPKQPKPDWQNAPGCKFLLANFLTPQTLDKLAIPPELVQILDDDPAVVIQQLLEAGVLQYVDPDETPESMFRKITVRELQAMLDARNLDDRGNKPELLHRLAMADRDALTRALLRRTPLQCTEEGQRIAAEYLSTEGRSFLSKLNLPDDRLLKFLGRVAEWIAAGVLGNAVYDALTKPDPDAQPEMPAPSPEPPSVHITRHPIEPEMVRIPAGSFLMGTSDAQVWAMRRRFDWAKRWGFKNEQPQHRVRLPAYEIGRYPITNAEYAAFVQATGHRAPRHWRDGRSPKDQAGHPVRDIGWYDAAAYVAWLRKYTGKPYRLPTEAEWEKAARGTRGRLWPWGNEPPDEKRCNFDQNIGTSTAVGRYSPQGDSPYGCADMAGNVWEWCQRKYAQYPHQVDVDPEHITAMDSQLLRGGAWYTPPRRVQCAYRLGHHPHNRFSTTGFRVARGPLG